MPRFTGIVLCYFRDSDGHLMSIDLDSGIRILNVYAPNDYRSQKDFFTALNNHLVGPSRVVLVEDFNCVLDRIDQQTFRDTTPKWTDRNGEGALRGLVDKLGLIDAWRALRPAQSEMTWAGRSKRSRIDRFYVSPPLAPSMHSSWVVSSPISDHYLLILRLAGTDIAAQETKKTNTGHSTNVKSGTPSEPPVLVKDFPPLTPVQAQVSCWGGAVSGPSSSPSPTETTIQQQIGELRRQNQILARKIQELEAKQVGSSEPVQEAVAEDGDDGSSVTSRLTSVSRQDADTVVGPASITGSIGRIESLEHKTEQLEASVPALPTQIMSAVRESFQDMFTAALTQALPEIVAQVSNSVLKAAQP
ncbi:hypothetical protein HPB51_000199 [Rhipicephalus microplus]|uniref:Uncharacterized protein n=1 Tax=Rhipicephalus microplus TaxID=6941 RepID=A0A9J6E5N8_RHIMP|nr:hypothetical protein HPB51_000199 [Rhipicephalus microplus]